LKSNIPQIKGKSVERKSKISRPSGKYHPVTPKNPKISSIQKNLNSKNEVERKKKFKSNTFRSPKKKIHTNKNLKASKLGKTNKNIQKTKKFIPKNVDPGDGREQCEICQRWFLPDRLGKHEDACYKINNTKRAKFDR